jgi:uncharacterized protein involved in tolerance to divalent cations
MYKGIYAYPWDLAGEGLDVTLGRIRESGLNTITLAMSCHAGAFVRPHGQTGEAGAAADGAVWFRVRPERYGHIRPRVHPKVEQFDALAELQRRAPDLGRAAWVVCCHNRPLGEEHPEYLSQNALGDRYPASLCPAHPAVRDYAVNLCADLAHGYDLAAVVLETPGWLPYDHAHHQASAKAPLDRFARTLLSVCFADATRHAARAAGVDADRLQAKARALLERHLAAGLAVPDAQAAEWWSADMVSDPEWAAFLNWRCRQVADLVTAVKSALPAGTGLAVIPSVQQPSAACWREGSDLGMLAGAADALEIPADQASAADLYVEAWDVRHRAGDDAALRFIFGLSHPDRANGAEMLEAARKLKQIGMSGIAFYHYGRLRHASLGPLKAVLAALDGS